MRPRLALAAMALIIPAAQADTLDFGIGPVGGYMKTRGADNGTWYGGLAARVRVLDYIGAEASVTYHANEYLDKAAVVSQIPVQLSALLYPFPNWPLQPYALAGAGWYYTRTDYRDALSGFDSETDSMFGVHLGAGLAYDAGPLSLFGDFRYVFLDEPGVDNSDLKDEEYDSWVVSFGVFFGF